MPALEIISVLGVGYDGIDLEAARDHNVCVTHTPGLSTEDIADFAMALLLCASRQVLSADRFVRRGEWTSGRYPMTARLHRRRRCTCGGLARPQDSRGGARCVW
ncbi:MULTISPECIES: hypothetical protein [Pseudomonas]|uniref:hypothetical protein n=1 Tax=Pseudomonas sp. BC115LW TaxID=2683267 RepID=UPI0018E06B97